MDLKQIKPKGKESDKYSIQLYRYLEKNYPEGCNVYYIQTQERWNDKLQKSEEIEVPLDKNKFSLRNIYIGNIRRENYNSEDVKGHIDWIYGNQLLNILGSSREKYTVFANPWYTNHSVIDITDWFWDEYIKVGRCIWDKQHNSWLADDKNRFTYINKNSRKCNWCGEWQHREIKKKVRIIREKTWVKDSEK